MKTNKSSETQNTAGMKIGIGMLVLLGFFVIWSLPLTITQLSFGLGDYNETFLVNTTVNITNAAPLITAIALDPTVNLYSYNITRVYCNVSTFDFDNDTIILNATLFIQSISQPSDPDDGNFHYSNTSCARTTVQNPNINWTCAFHVQYYANNNSNWICNATANDAGFVPTSNLSNLATINPLVAIKMESLLDYGDLAVGQTSNDTVANVTNAGNRDANISVDGYGAVDGDGLAFVCDFGNIPLSLERYAVINGTAFPSMTQLTDSITAIPSFYVPQRTSEVTDSVNSTFWKVQIPVGAGGVCNGKILFTATDRGN